MILINKGTDEPYSMFTSRAEYRTLLRQDNADLRLTEMSHKLGLASDERLAAVDKKKQEVQDITKLLNMTSVEAFEINGYLRKIDSAPIVEKQKLSKVLLRPDVGLCDVIQHIPALREKFDQFSQDALEQSEIQVKYERYIEKEEQLVAKQSDMENFVIPDVFNYDTISALSNEALQKFKKIKPRTIGQASRISGVNPSDIQILMVYMGR